MLPTFPLDVPPTGIVVYGYIRDSAAVNKMDIGVKALGTHPRKTEKKDIGDVDVRGDLILFWCRRVYSRYL